jgi:hypothetical protein
VPPITRTLPAAAAIVHYCELIGLTFDKLTWADEIEIIFAKSRLRFYVQQRMNKYYESLTINKSEKGAQSKGMLRNYYHS